MKIGHDHADADRLTFGCAGCIARVREDQRLAAIAELPLRKLTVRYRATIVEHGTVTLEVHADKDESAGDVADRNADEIDELIASDLMGSGDYDIEYDDVELGDIVERQHA